MVLHDFLVHGNHQDWVVRTVISVGSQNAVTKSIGRCCRSPYPPLIGDILNSTGQVFGSSQFMFFGIGTQGSCACWGVWLVLQFMCDKRLEPSNSLAIRFLLELRTMALETGGHR